MRHLDAEFGNPGSRTHSLGRAAAEAVDKAREQLSGLIQCAPEELIFTSGATESNNLAIRGLGEANSCSQGHIITSVTEHKSVLDPVHDLFRHGWSATVLPSSHSGRITSAQVEHAIQRDTRLVSIMWANNETGVINDIESISSLCQERGVILHVDAAQAVGKLPVSVAQIPVDMLSISAHKMYGPKGVGALFVRKSVQRQLRPLLHGGGQERGLRSGTVPVHQVVGLGTAADLARTYLKGDGPDRVRALRDLMLQLLVEELGDVQLNGDAEHRLPGNLNVWLPNCDTEALAMRCEEVAFSTGSACNSASLEPSYVIRAMTGSEKRASESARFGIGRDTSEADIRFAVEHISRHARDLRGLASLFE